MGSSLPLVGTAVLLALGLSLKAQPLLLMAGLLAFTSAAAAFWGRHSLDRVAYRHSLDRSRCFVGESVLLTVEVINRKPLPVPALVVEELMPAELEVASRRLAVARPGKGVMRLTLALSWYQEMIRRYTVTPVRRGWYEVGPAALWASDPFGCAHARVEVAERIHLVVYPKVLPLERFGIPTRRPFGDLRSQDRLFTDPFAVAGVREYQPGDPLNRIHWKATAVVGRLQVQKLEPSAQPGVAVLLNTWAFAHHWEGPNSEALEVGCSLAASIGAWGERQRVSVGLYANALVAGWGSNLHLPPARGSGALQRMLEGLARIQMPSRQSPCELLATAAEELSYGTSLVYITPRVDGELAGQLVKVHRSGRPVTVVLVGRLHGELPEMPGVRTYVVPGEEALHEAVLA